MVYRYIFCLTLLLFGILLSPLHAQQPPSCEDQLAEVIATLAFVRSGRQNTEDTAARVTATLQKRLDISLKELDKRNNPKPTAQESSVPATPEKDDAL